MSTPTRPLLRWFGGKWRLAPWIIGHFPQHRVYVEPFGGAGSVLIRKPRSYAEVYNDVDGEVVNLFRVCRVPTDAARLVELLQLTPFARDEFEGAYYSPSADPIERARQLVVLAYMGFGSNAHNTGHKTGFRSNSNRSHTTPAHDWQAFPPALEAIIKRLRGVVIENRDAMHVCRQHDSPATLHYLDPPYVHETRGNDKRYRHEMTDAQHVALLGGVLSLSGAVVISGYAHPLYDAMLSGWQRVERAAMADGARKRTEVLWMRGPL